MDADLKSMITAILKSNQAVVEAQQGQIKELRALIAIEKEAGDKATDSKSSLNGSSIEQCRALEALSNMIDPFQYDEENGLTFEAWYNRFRGIITVGAAQFDDPAKVELVLMRLETRENALYRKSIAPVEPTAISFEETIKKLTTLFKKKISLLRTRWNCLNIQRMDGEDIAAYGARVNQETVDFDLKALTDQQFKVLVFIMGLQNAKDKSVRTRLLNLQDKTEAKDVSLQSMVTEAERIIQIEKDSVIGSHSDTIHLVSAPQTHQQSNSNNKGKSFNPNSKPKPSSSSSSVPRTPCWQCGALHYVKDCNYANHTCTRCGGEGHKEGYCDALGNKSKFGKQREQQQHERDEQVRLVVNHSPSADRPIVNRLFVDVFVNNAKLTLQFDSGSDLTVISQSSWMRIGSPPLSPTESRPTDYHGRQLEVLGEVLLDPIFKGQTIRERCIVTSSKIELFGLEWINGFGLLDLPLSSICNAVSFNKRQTEDSTQGEFASVTDQLAPSLFNAPQPQGTQRALPRLPYQRSGSHPNQSMAVVSMPVQDLSQIKEDLQLIIAQINLRLRSLPVQQDQSGIPLAAQQECSLSEGEKVRISAIRTINKDISRSGQAQKFMPTSN